MSPNLQRLPRNLAAVLIFSRPPLVFLAFGCAVGLMFRPHPLIYISGLSLLLLAFVFDWVDGWFADRYMPSSRLGPLVDRMMDRMVLSIIFPVLAVGMFWRLSRLETLGSDVPLRLELLHAIFVAGICVMVLLRDQFAQFLRSFAMSAGQESESAPLTRLSSLVASPLMVLLYALAFYQPTEGWERFYNVADLVQRLPMRFWFTVEIIFLLLNIGSITLALRKYGALALGEICADDELLRRRILAVIPNTLTLFNGMLGIVAVLFASQGQMRESLFVLLGAAFVDRLDGLLARRLGLTEPLPDRDPPRISMGALLDDISDGISFAIAPGIIFYIVMSDLAEGMAVAWLVPLLAVIYPVAGIARLIYFTLDKKPIPGFFKGMPVPAAALLAISPVEFAFQAQSNFPDLVGPSVQLSIAITALAALVMVLFPVRYLHIGRAMGRNPWLLRGLGTLAIVMLFTPFFGLVTLLVMLMYLLSPPLTWRIDPNVAQRERRESPRPG